MKRSRYSEGQIAFALRQAESGTPVNEVCRKMGVTEQSFYRWNRKYAGMVDAFATHIRPCVASRLEPNDVKPPRP